MIAYTFLLLHEEKTKYVHTRIDVEIGPHFFSLIAQFFQELNCLIISMQNIFMTANKFTSLHVFSICRLLLHQTYI